MHSMVNVYSSCACNRGPHTADWGRNGLIIYGACNAVAVYEYKYGGGGKVTSTFCHHKGYVTSVRWVRDNKGSLETEFISTSVDGSAVVWSLIQGSNYNPCVLAGHNDTVSVADGIYLSEKTMDTRKRSMLVATASIDSSIMIWKRNVDEDSFSIKETLNFNSVFCLCVRFHLFPDSKNVLMACACDDNKVHLYAEEGLEFSKVDSITGHKDFVWTVDVTTADNGDLLLASGSQDATIRLSKISSCQGPSSKSGSEKMPENEKVFAVSDHYYCVESETVLNGHQSAVYGVCWHPGMFFGEGEKQQQPMKLLSSSLDTKAVIWALHKSTRVWEDDACLGDLRGENVIGFFGGKFGPDGLTVLAHGFQGNFHLWEFCKNTCVWEILVPVGGHFGEVPDIQWEPDGDFLLSVGTDQTTRVHAPWVKSDNIENVTWHEVARPQVHGYDMSCIAVLSRYIFASGAEEKIVRVFKAPKCFQGNILRICKVKHAGGEENLPFGATVTSLQLSNKPVYSECDLQEVQYNDKKNDEKFVSLDLKDPPSEEQLGDTLWPEIHKLYGHGFDIYCLAAHPSGKIMASACKAAKPEHAGIALWNTETWEMEQMLLSHSLTVTQMEFSPNGHYILSVSRDRRWSLFKRTDSDQGEVYQLAFSTDKTNCIHSRIIWTCSWSPDSQYFATGSRDGKVVIWPCNTGPLACSTVSEFKGQSVTAVAFAPLLVKDNYVVAVGFESGLISISTWNRDSKIWKELIQLNNNTAHHLTVKRLCFRPGNASVLASCGADHFVKIYDLATVYMLDG